MEIKGEFLALQVLNILCCPAIAVKRKLEEANRLRLEDDLFWFAAEASNSTSRAGVLCKFNGLSK